MTAPPAIRLLPGELAIVRLEPADPVPEWASGGPFVSLTRTPEELSVVCLAAAVPRSVEAERGWRALEVQGPLAFDLIGILAGISRTLADANVSLFAVSTHDTDFILVPGVRLSDAIDALRAAGHRVTD
jgi:hypothetical protein